MNSPPPAVAPRRRLSLRLLVFLMLPLLLLAAAISTGATWLVRTTSGLHAIVGALNVVLPARLEVTGLRGSLAEGLGFDELRVPAGRSMVVIHKLEARIAGLRINAWTPSASAVAIDTVQAQDVRIVLPAVSTPEPAAPPDTIALPVTLDAQQLSLGHFVIERGKIDADKAAFGMRAIDAALAFGPQGLDVRRFSAEVAGNALTVVGTIRGTRPFALEAGGTLASRVVVGGGQGAAPDLDAPVQVTWRAANSLEHIDFFAGVTGGPNYTARGSIRARIDTFNPLPLMRLAVDVEGVDPSAWWRGAPRALLRVDADLGAERGPAFALAGPVRAVNSAPGPSDRQQIPARELTATLAIDGQSFELSNARAAIGAGTARGSFTLGWAPARRWQVDAQLDNIDLAAIHSRAQPLAVSGTLAAQTEPAATRVRAQLRGASGARAAALLSVDLAVDENRLTLDEGRLQVGEGNATATGEMALTGDREFAFTGALRGLDLGALIKGLDGPQATRLNGELRAEGRLRPAPVAGVRIALADSLALGRPLSGRAQLDWRGDESVQVDAELAVRSATLMARGALAGDSAATGAAPGAAVDSSRGIVLTLEANEMAELGIPVSGALSARATLTGSWRAPAVDGSLSARNLRSGEQRLKSLAATLRYGGGSDGALALEVNAAGHTHPRGAALSLARAALTAQGSLPAMRLELSATTSEDAVVTAVANGGWSKETARWAGTLEQLEAGGDFATRLVAPAPMSAGADKFALGPMALTVRGGNFEAVRFETRPGRFATSGRFDTLALAASGVRDEPRLTLRGAWDLRAAETLDGSLAIERASGDVFSGPETRRVRMGLQDLRLEATLRANRLQSSAVMRGSEVGTLAAALRAELERDAQAGWRLAGKHGWSGELTGAAPSVEWINPFLSANLRDNVRVAGRADVDVKLGGTPDEPRATGAINADALRLAWVEQGVRLDNGSLRARLAPDAKGATELIIDGLTFSGQPRVRPQDRRIVVALAGQPDGTVFASGSVKLPALDGVIQVRAERFPVLQRPDRWAVATGGANLVFSPKRVQLNGAVIAHAGYIDISRRDAPTLSGDVIVRREVSGVAPAKTEPRVPFEFTLGIDLGNTFVVRGDGLDSRVEGALLLKHEGRGIVRATGVLEARDGIYEGFGQKLAIERGRLNFLGSVENPGLDILALRKGLPVEVGVTIGRSAANPLVRLYSDPAMADFETLSWLVLGRPADESRGDNVALARAALGLLGGSGEGIPNQLARRLGIDELSVRAADSGTGSASLLPRQSVAGRVRGEVSTVSGEIVSIGKRLSDNLTLSYETATTGAANVVQLSYQLTRRVSVIARAGTENALDLVYSFAFD
jgi:translocation and assembly module TamB